MKAGSVLLLMPSIEGPAVYLMPSMRDALDLLARWARSRCADEGLSVWVAERRKWVPV